MSRHKVPDEQEDGHDHVFCDGDHVGAGNLENLHTMLDGGVQVNVVRPNTSGDTELEVFGLGEELLCEVARVERGGDQNLSLVVTSAYGSHSEE